MGKESFKTRNCQISNLIIIFKNRKDSCQIDIYNLVDLYYITKNGRDKQIEAFH